MGKDSEKRIIAIIAEALSVDLVKINLESNFVDDLGADSLDTAEMLIELENEFGYTISEEDLPNVKTVQDLIGFMKAKGVETNDKN